MDYFYSIDQHLVNAKQNLIESHDEMGSVFMLTVGFYGLINLGGMVAVRIKPTSLCQNFWPMSSVY